MTTTWMYRIALGLLVAALLYVFFPNSEPNPRPHFWDIQLEKQQISLLGLRLYDNRLSDVVQRLRVTPTIAMFTKRQRPNQAVPKMFVEAYFEDVFDEDDRVIVGLAASDALLAHIKKSALRPELFPNDVIRVAIPEALNGQISMLQIKNITFIAGERLKFEEFKAKMGEPTQLLDDGQGNAHFLYPELGLDFIQPSDGLQVLQFVDPAAFEALLLTPLQTSDKRP
ncbi:MAG: hypothetical protein Q9M19_06130 [Mariprofundaceae bacterium]|nr:hypothetical protein [Mariprofundaceae bacterium]